MKVDVAGLTKEYPGQRALDAISFSLDTEEILCILGPSGSGKSTLLRCLCGLEEKDEGRISLEGINQEIIEPAKEKIAFVFDEPRLFAHLTVYDNIALGLQEWDRNQICQRVHEVAEEVEIMDTLSRYPNQLSAGQKQRVSLARALVRDCRLLLLDEALSHLDEMLKKKLIALLFQLKERYHFSCLYVTHSRYEAKLLNARTMILDQGKILQLDSWENCINKPSCEKVTAFLEE